MYIMCIICCTPYNIDIVSATSFILLVTEDGVGWTDDICIGSRFEDSSAKRTWLRITSIANSTNRRQRRGKVNMEKISGFG